MGSMSTDDILDKFGGVAGTAALCNCKKNAVYNWRRAGIPAKFWHVLAHAAAEKKIDGLTIAVISQARSQQQAAA